MRPDCPASAKRKPVDVLIGAADEDHPRAHAGRAEDGLAVAFAPANRTVVGLQAKYLAVASRERLKGAPDVPTFKERGIDFQWEQYRGVVGPANMGDLPLKWWQETLKKVVATPKWQEQYIKRNLLTPVFWVGEEANEYLDGLRTKYQKALTDLGAVKK